MIRTAPRLFAAVAGLCAAFALAFASPAARATPAVGEAAPAFKLQDQTGEWRSLADYRGKWVVLYFYPKDGTPG
ncbi:MAG: redoxin domain-containing protein, partial [Gammaproteobacteria bacterium]